MRFFAAILSVVVLPIIVGASLLLLRESNFTALAHAPSGAIFTTAVDGSAVDANIYQNKNDVYLDGGPPANAPSTAAGLDAGDYYFQVTDPSGKSLLSQDPVKCRRFSVNDAGVIAAVVAATANGNKPCQHKTGIDQDHAGEGAITVQLMPYANTPNRGGVYKVWATHVEDFVGDAGKVDNPCVSGCFHGFLPAHSKTDNYKVHGRQVPPKITFLKFYDADADGVEDPDELQLADWEFLVTDPLGVATSVFTGPDGAFTIDPADEGSYQICELLPVEPNWQPTTPVCQNVTVANGDAPVLRFGNVYRTPMSGGLTIGYWKTHSSLGPAGPRDDTYDQLPIVLGVASNGISDPEVDVSTEAIAVDVLTTAGEGCSGNCLAQMKAQELGAKLNCLKFAGFCTATFGVGGPTVESVIAQADQLLDDVAAGLISGDDAIKALAQPLEAELDLANNNESSPILFSISPVPGPYSF